MGWQRRFNLLLVMAPVAVVFGGAAHGAGERAVKNLKIHEIQLFNHRRRVAGLQNDTKGNGLGEACTGEKVCRPLSPRNSMTAARK